MSRCLTPVSIAFVLVAALNTTCCVAIWLGPNGIEAQDFAKCPTSQETFGSISLGHAGDVWSLTCRPAPSNADLDECYWSGFQNAYTERINFTCSEDYVITEVEKLYDQDKVDLRLNFKCCRDRDYVTHACHLTSEIDDVGTHMDLVVPEGEAIAGWFSGFQSRGRSHEFKLCKLRRQ